MKRIIDYFLLAWKNNKFRKPLLLRGARQVGKTFAVRSLGKTYTHFVEINFELYPSIALIFEQDLNPHRIIQELSLQIGQRIIPGQTLLFLDEVQLAPQVIIALRYFYELLPELHIVAAGSLLDFAIAQVGVPTGRVDFLYMYPLSFIEYLAAIEEHMLIEEILRHDLTAALFDSLHQKLLQYVGHYIALGGMPEVIARWIETRDIIAVHDVHASIMNSYRHDFHKYARTLQIKYVELVFKHIPYQLGGKFKYSDIEGEFRKRELAPALDLLITAGVARKIFYSAGQGLPLGAQIDPLDYKVIFLDIGLAQYSLGLDIKNWFLQSKQEFINKGSIVEAFAGQEIATYGHPVHQYDLYYWHKDSAPAQAEIDYLIEFDNKVIPIEVKSGDGRTLKSMQYFLAHHIDSPYGVKFSTHNYSEYLNIHSYPLYAIVKVMADKDSIMKSAITSLLAD
jgi:predicted AAA+ superfamily ATPase